jgi:tetratricopeptide (TPR) repeat protein
MASKRKLGESSGTRSSHVTTASLSTLLSQLSLAAAEDDHEKAVKVATDVLAADPTNAHAAKQKAVALIKLDKYKEALAFLDEATFLNSAEVMLERGFCLYKLGRGKEAIVLAQNV